MSKKIEIDPAFASNPQGEGGGFDGERELTRKYALAAFRQRLHQAAFRQRVLRA